MSCKQRFYLGEILHNDIGNKRNATSSTFGMICFIKCTTRKCLLSVQRGLNEASLSFKMNCVDTILWRHFNFCANTYDLLVYL